MKLYWLPPLIAALLLALGVVATACGGDGDGSRLTVDEYFQELQEVFDEYEERNVPLAKQLDTLVTSDTPDWEQVREAFREMGALSRALFNDLDKIKPPDVAAEAHDEYVGAGRDAFQQLVRVADFDSESEGEEYLNQVNETFLESSMRALAACFELEEIAAENGIEIDLKCGEF